MKSKITLLPGEDVVLVAVVLPTVQVWTGNLPMTLRAADLVLTPNP